MTETQTDGPHADGPDACSIHAAMELMEANHRNQMRMGWAILAALVIVLVCTANGAANRAAAGKPIYGASTRTSAPAAPVVAPAATQCAPLEAGCTFTGSGGSLATQGRL